MGNPSTDSTYAEIPKGTDFKADIKDPVNTWDESSYDKKTKSGSLYGKLVKKIKDYQHSSKLRMSVFFKKSNVGSKRKWRHIYPKAVYIFDTTKIKVKMPYGNNRLIGINKDNFPSNYTQGSSAMLCLGKKAVFEFERPIYFKSKDDKIQITEYKPGEVYSVTLGNQVTATYAQDEGGMKTDTIRDLNQLNMRNVHYKNGGVSYADESTTPFETIPFANLKKVVGIYRKAKVKKAFNKPFRFMQIDYERGGDNKYPGVDVTDVVFSSVKAPTISFNFLLDISGSMMDNIHGDFYRSTNIKVAPTTIFDLSYRAFSKSLDALRDRLIYKKGVLFEFNIYIFCGRKGAAKNEDKYYFEKHKLSTSDIVAFSNNAKRFNRELNLPFTSGTPIKSALEDTVKQINENEDIDQSYILLITDGVDEDNEDYLQVKSLSINSDCYLQVFGYHLTPAIEKLKSSKSIQDYIEQYKKHKIINSTGKRLDNHFVYSNNPDIDSLTNEFRKMFKKIYFGN